MSLKEVVGNIKDLYQLDQSKWEKQVTDLEPTNLLKELNRNRKILSINQRINRLEAMGLVLTFTLGGMSGSPEVTFGSAGALVALVFLHGRPGVVLRNRIDFVGTEIAARQEKAIFYQDTNTLDVLDASHITS